MKKLKGIDALGYKAKEFDKWLDKRTNKILKRAIKMQRLAKGGVTCLDKELGTVG